jgi:16S rRNA (cytosine967-C5)-methyltransferase
VPIKLEPNARTIAAHVVERVYGEDAFAAAVLDAALDRYPELERRERALATELAYGTLRTAPYVETRLSKHAPRGTSKLDESVRAHLLVAGYQLLFLDRVPAFAAVSEGVRQITRGRGKALGSFANAILRRLAEESRTDDKRITLELARRESISHELREALVRSVGADEADALVDTSAAPPIGLRTRWGKGRGDPFANDRDAWMVRLREAATAATFEPGRVSPLAILMRGGGDPQNTTAFRDGDLAIHEEGAQVVTLSLGAAPGEKVLDACAGRGNKTALLVEMVGATGAVDAADQHPQKLARLATELSRLGLGTRAAFAVDWSVGSGAVPSAYDRVLVDAPCSGTGTIRRRPDLATRWRAAELPGLQDLQARILVAAAERAKPGGSILYAVCSVLREEGEDVVARALERAPWLSPSPFDGDPARTIAGDAHTLRLTPSAHGTDGYFLASFRRR